MESGFQGWWWLGVPPPPTPPLALQIVGMVSLPDLTLTIRESAATINRCAAVSSSDDSTEEAHLRLETRGSSLDGHTTNATPRHRRQRAAVHNNRGSVLPYQTTNWKCSDRAHATMKLHVAEQELALFDQPGSPVLLRGFRTNAINPPRPRKFRRRRERSTYRASNVRWSASVQALNYDEANGPSQSRNGVIS